METVLRLTILFALSCPLHESGAESSFESLAKEANRILQTSFPDAKLALGSRGDRENHAFSTRMRKFMVYTPNRIGDWQGPFETSAPDRGGFFVSYYIEAGPWMGALAVPCVGTEDHYLFKLSHVIKESKDQKYHIHATIMTRRYDSDDKLRDALIKLFSDFDAHRLVTSPRKQAKQ